MGGHDGPPIGLYDLHRVGGDDGRLCPRRFVVHQHDDEYVDGACTACQSVHGYLHGGGDQCAEDAVNHDHHLQCLVWNPYVPFCNIHYCIVSHNHPITYPVLICLSAHFLQINYLCTTCFHQQTR